MRIGVIGAMQIEVDNLKASMSDISTKEYSGVTYAVSYTHLTLPTKLEV